MAALTAAADSVMCAENLENTSKALLKSRAFFIPLAQTSLYSCILVAYPSHHDISITAQHIYPLSSFIGKCI
jgi:hypothetical protein